MAAYSALRPTALLRSRLSAVHANICVVCNTQSVMQKVLVDYKGAEGILGEPKYHLLN